MIQFRYCIVEPQVIKDNKHKWHKTHQLTLQEYHQTTTELAMEFNSVANLAIEILFRSLKLVGINKNCNFLFN